MAWYDDGWDDVGDYYDAPDPAPPINDILFGDFATVDQHAQDLFVQAFFNDNQEAYAELVEYMYDQYGMDFEEVFDWEDFREWYDAG